MPKFYCVHCGQRIDAPDDVAGSQSACPTCSDEIGVPKIPETQPLTRKPAPLPIERASGKWDPPGRNYCVACPKCKKITSYINAKVPIDITCRRCKCRFIVDRVSYSVSRFVWFLLGVGVLCAISVAFLVEAKMISRKEIANLFGKSAESEFWFLLAGWGGVAFILLVILVLPIAYFSTELSRRRFKLSAISATYGGSVTIGWWIIIPYLATWNYTGLKKLHIERAAENERRKETIEVHRKVKSEMFKRMQREAQLQWFKDN